MTAEREATARAAARILHNRALDKEHRERQRVEDRVFADQLARVRNPVEYERRKAQLRQMRAEAAEDVRTTATCPYCGTVVPFVADGDNDCPVCGKELGVDLDPGMYEPSRLPLTVPIT